jgi:branched-chain amino acid transport system substrate-binding protein
MNWRRFASTAGISVGVGLAAMASAGVAGSARTSARAGSCQGSVGVMGGFTGARAAIGQEELDWAKFAVSQFNKSNRSQFKLVEGDIQVDPALASTVGQEFASDSSVLGVVGPDASSAVVVAGPIFKRAGLAFISGSATRVSLTNGQFPTFFRDVPNDNVQAPTDASFMISQLHAKNVVLVDNQTDYSLGLNTAIAGILRAHGVTVERLSTTTTQTDFSSLIPKIGSDASVVFLPLEVPADAELFAEQLASQGNHATIFGSDSVFSPSDFHPAGAYVSSFAPDVHQLPADAALVRAYDAQFGKFATPFGPPVYEATQAILRAIQASCAQGTPTRAAVLAQVRRTQITNSILGGTLSFKRSGEPAAATFYIYKIASNGSYQLVR